jgi:hypothetical protein
VHDVTCEIVTAMSAELALGIADGKERAIAAAHLEQCPACRSYLREMMEVAEGLVDLLPPAEPPSGFESKVLASVSASAAVDAPLPTRARRKWHLPSLWAVAAVALAALIAAGGWLVGATGHSTTIKGVVSATLMASRRSVGQVLVVGGDDPWLSMSVDAPLPATTVRCQIREANGTLMTVGAFSVADGYGYWATALPSSTPIEAAQLVSSTGHVLASATFPAGTPTHP